MYVKSLLVVSSAALLAVSMSAPLPAIADDEPVKIDCTKEKNKNKPACKPKRGEASDDEVYNAAYWMAHQGQYREALGVLDYARDQSDPRILTAIGFATRKLGDVDAALPFYAKALAIRPDYVLAREYLGEAYLSMGDLASAKIELNEIAARCGLSCTAYTHLNAHIKAVEASGTRPG